MPPKLKSIAKLRLFAACYLRQLAINKAVKNFTKRLNACAKDNSGHFDFLQSLANCLLCCSNDIFFCSANMLSFCTYFAAWKREKWRC